MNLPTPESSQPDNYPISPRIQDIVEASVPDVERLPRVSLPAATIYIGEELKNQLLQLPESHPQAQLAIIDQLQQLGLPVEETLRDAAIRSKMGVLNLEDLLKNDEFTDPTLSRLQRGHQVEIWMENPSSGYSRGAIDFLLNFPDREKIIVLGSDTPTKSPVQKSDGSIEDEKIDHLRERLIAQRNKVTYIRGTVAEPPGGSNGWVVKLLDGQELHSAKVCLVNVVGIDRELIVDRPQDKLFANQRIWVFADGAWRGATVIEPDGDRGTATAICDDLVDYDREFYGGRGVTLYRSQIGKDFIPSPDEHLRAPPSVPHPLEFHPHIKLDQPLRFQFDNNHRWGKIDAINIVRGLYRVEDTTQHRFELPFGCQVKLLNNSNPDPINPIIRAGNLIVPGIVIKESPVVLKILGIDTELGKLLTERVDRIGRSEPLKLLPLSRYQSREFQHQVLDREYAFEALTNRFRWAGSYDIHDPALKSSRISFYDHQNILRSGCPLDMKTFPAYLEILIRRTREEMAANPNVTDVFHRYLIKPDMIVDWTKA